jgi:DNA-binding CsgD family transcriptional regulator
VGRGDTAARYLQSRGRPLVVAACAEGADLSEPGLILDPRSLAFGVVDHDWRISDLSADAAELLDWDVGDSLRTPLQAMVHPDDVSLLLLTLGRSGAERRAAVTRLRVRDAEGGWTPVRLAVSPLCDHHPSRYAVAFSVHREGDDSESASERASRLEGHIWRIAVEAQSAGIADLPRSSRGWWADPTLRGLSPRKSEILRRLARGERVPAIARGLFVSQSTVRNHLSAIYRKVGVHSQAELLARLIPASE